MTSKRATFAPRAFASPAPVVIPPPSKPTQVHFQPPVPVRLNPQKPVIVPNATSSVPQVSAPKKVPVVIPPAVKVLPVAGKSAAGPIVIAKPLPSAPSAPVVVVVQKPQSLPVVAAVQPSKPAAKDNKSAVVSSPAPAPQQQQQAKIDNKAQAIPAPPTADSTKALFSKLAKFKVAAAAASGAQSVQASAKPAVAASSVPAAKPSSTQELFSKLAKFKGAQQPQAASVPAKPSAAPIKKDASSGVSLVTLLLVLGVLAVAFNVVGGGGMQSGALRNPTSGRCFASKMFGASMSSNCAGSSAKLFVEQPIGGNARIHPYSDPNQCATNKRGSIAFKACDGSAAQQWDLSQGHVKSVSSQQQNQPKCLSVGRFASSWSSLTDCAASNPAQIFHFQSSRS